MLQIPVVLTRALIAFSLILFSANTIADKDGQLDTLMEASGLNAQMGKIPEQFNAGLQQGVAQSGAPEDVANELIQSIGGSISSLNLLSEIRTSLDAGMSEDEVAKLNEWFESDLGKKITALEIRSSSEAESQHIMANLDSLLANHERVGMARRVEDALGGSDLTVNMMKTMQLAMVNAMMGDAPQTQKDAVYGQIEQQMDLVLPQITQMTLASYVHTYASLSDNELDPYLAFLGQPEAIKFYDLSTSAIGSALGKAIGVVFPEG